MRLLRVSLLICATIGSLRAQATLGGATVGGTVSDPSGAAIPEAQVTLTETERGLSRQATANAAGSYLFPSIGPGTYSLRVTKESFETYELKDIHVEVGQLATLDVTLRVGQVSTVMSVSAEKLILLEAQSNVIGTVVDSQLVESLPLNGRDFLQLALMTAGVEAPTGAANSQIGQVGHPNRAVIIGGLMFSTTGYIINGISTRGGRVGESALNLSIAAVDQFKVQQSFFMPDQGPNPSLVNVTTKGGGNQFHGQAFEYVRNENFDSRSFFAVAPEALKRNQFGGALGGPIKKDKIWFFGNYEGLRQLSAFTSSAYTPTAAMFGGDFSEVPQTIYDPNTFSTDTGRRQPFPNNVIPSNRISPITQALLKYYLPGASLNQRPSNLFANPRNTLDDDQYSIRIDAALSARQNLFGQFFHDDSPAVQPGIMPLSGARYPNEFQMIMAQHTFTLSPTLVNTFRFGASRNQALFANRGSSEGDILNRVGIPNSKDPRGVIAVGIQGFAGFGNATGDIGNIDNNYQLDDGVNYTRGPHSFQFGAGIRYRRTWQQNANANAVGSLTFQSQFSAQLAANAQGQLAPQSGTGNAFADYLLGMPTTAYTAGLPRIPYRFTQFMPYFQDTWKIRRSLTLNYGISWFVASIPNPQGAYQQLAHGFDLQTGLLTYSALKQVDPRIMSVPLNHFTPRFGFAWKPDILPNTVIRSGVGAYFADAALIELQASMVAPPYNTPVQLNNDQFNPLPTYLLGRNIFPASPIPASLDGFAASLPNGSSAFVLDANGRTPYVTQWNLSIEHSFSGSDVLELAYLGSSSHKLQDRWDLAACRPTSTLRCDAATKLYPRYQFLQMVNFDGNASYEALFVKYRRRASRGLNFNVEYMFSKALTDGSEGAGSVAGQFAFCRACDRGRMSTDQPHRVVLNAVYELPVGRGRTFGRDMSRVTDLLAGGWIFTGITTFAAGTPIVITSPNTTSTVNTTVRPNRICNGADDRFSGNLRSNGFVDFDTSCFSSPPVGFFGNSGRNPIYGPGINNWDLGLQKTFPLPFRERTRFEFRAEFFNAFNHAQFNPPNGNTGSGANFGRISGARAPRLIQLGIKVIF